MKKKVFFFHFMQKKYAFDVPSSDFVRLKPRVDGILAQRFLSENKLQDTILFDKNELEIPIRRFRDVLREQLLEPFSFFQIFSVCLWMMDGNVFYPMITLFMLFVSSCIVVIQRMRTLLMLR